MNEPQCPECGKTLRPKGFTCLHVDQQAQNLSVEDFTQLGRRLIYLHARIDQIMGVIQNAEPKPKRRRGRPPKAKAG